MKKIFLSLTAGALLCASLPQPAMTMKPNIEAQEMQLLSADSNNDDTESSTSPNTNGRKSLGMAPPMQNTAGKIAQAQAWWGSLSGTKKCLYGSAIAGGTLLGSAAAGGIGYGIYAGTSALIVWLTPPSLAQEAKALLMQNQTLPLELFQNLKPDTVQAFLGWKSAFGQNIALSSGNRTCTVETLEGWQKCITQLQQPTTTTTTTTTTPEPTTTTTTTTTPEPTTTILSSFAEGILFGSTPINFMQASDFRDLVSPEQQKVNQYWCENHTPDTPFYFIEEGIPCRVEMPTDVNFCRTRTVDTISDANIDTAVYNRKITLEMISTIPQHKIDKRIQAGNNWSQYLYNKEGKYLRKNGSNVYFYRMQQLNSQWHLPWNILMEGKDTEDADNNTYTWH